MPCLLMYINMTALLQTNRYASGYHLRAGLASALAREEAAEDGPGSEKADEKGSDLRAAFILS